MIKADGILVLACGGLTATLFINSMFTLFLIIGLLTLIISTIIFIIG